jgi:enoyl-[acyl-carrier protein] reductase II
LKELTPVRLLKNPFFDELMTAYETGADKTKLQEVLGRGRAKKGMFMGDLENGELEIGQIAGLIDSIIPAAEIVHEIITEFQLAITEQKHYL